MDALETTLLFDTYGEMLTDKQRKYMNLRYNQDLSLGEIAQVMGVSRQAVFDNLTRTEALLRRMEEHIGCLRQDRVLREATAEILGALALLERSADPTVLSAADTIRRAVQSLEE